MIDITSSQASRLIDLTTNNLQTYSKTKILTITSGKGGVGKSTITANIAFLLSQKGLKVAVLDADIGLANMQVLFDIRPQNSFFEYINGTKDLEEIILQTNYENISLIAGKSGYQYTSNKNSFVFSRVVKDLILLNRFDILLVDTGAGLNDYVKEFLSISDNILAVTTTDPSALTDVYSLMKMLSIDKSKLMLCFNHTKSYQIGETISNSLIKLGKKNKLKEEFMVEYVGNISSSMNIPTTARLRKLFAKEFSFDEITIQLQQILARVLVTIY